VSLVGRDAVGDGGLDESGHDASEQLVTQGTFGCGALGLVGDLHDLVDAGRTEGLDLGVDRRGVVHLGGVRHDRLGAVGGHDGLDELALQRDDLGDVLLGLVECGGQCGLVDLRGAVLVVAPGTLGAAGLDHHDGDVAALELTTGDHDLEGGLVALFVGGVRDPLTVGGVRQAHRTDRALDRDVGDHECRGGTVDREHVVGVLLVGAEDGADDVDLVAEVRRERRAQRPVDQATGQDRGLGRTALTTEERAGDLAGGVHALLDVHRQREEVDALTDMTRSGGGHQDAGLAHAAEHCSAGERGELARLERDGLVFVGTDRCFDAYRCGHVASFDPPRGRSVRRGQFPVVDSRDIATGATRCSGWVSDVGNR
jgi:hypothetical protein